MTIEQNINTLLLRARDIETLAKSNDGYRTSKNYSTDVDGWINDVDIFYQRYLQDHPLRKRIQTLIFHRAKSCFQELISCLQSISRDNYFLDKECGNMKEYEKFLQKCIEAVDQQDPYHRIFQYELQGNDRAIIEKLETLGCITNITYMGMKYVGFDITYDGMHYFDEKDEEDYSIGELQRATAAFANNTARADEEIEYDLFLSHASMDKILFVEDLKRTLDQLGISIFYDKDSIDWGDNWKDKILEGVAKSEFAIIVISENFFGREWTEKELSDFLERQNSSGQKIILPILFNITIQQLEGHYPKLAGLQAISAHQYTKEEITILFAKQYIKRLRCMK